MEGSWTPYQDRPVTVPPTRRQVEAARELCIDLLVRVIKLIENTKHTLRRYEQGKTDAKQRMLALLMVPGWADRILEMFAEIDDLNEQANEVVKRWALFFDRFSGGVLSVGNKSYSNAFLAILGFVTQCVARTDDTREILVRMDRWPPVREETVALIASLALDVWNAGVSVAGADLDSVYSRLKSCLRVESAKAAAAVTRATPSPRRLKAKPVLSGEEEMIIKALRKKKKHMTQEQLLNAAGLAIHGTNKSILAQMVQRELIDNGTDKRGRGYGLPEWRSKTS